VAIVAALKDTVGRFNRVFSAEPQYPSPAKNIRSPCFTIGIKERQGPFERLEKCTFIIAVLLVRSRDFSVLFAGLV